MESIYRCPGSWNRPAVPKLRRAHHFGETQYPSELLETVDAIRSGMFGDAGVFEPLLSTLFEGKDYCEICESERRLNSGSRAYVQQISSRTTLRRTCRPNVWSTRPTLTVRRGSPRRVSGTARPRPEPCNRSDHCTNITVYTTARMGKFSSDRSVLQYCEEIWSIEPHVSRRRAGLRLVSFSDSRARDGFSSVEQKVQTVTK